ncbi:DinB family protein [Arenibacter algicola]|uniref:DinB superfamily protein n=1 Tax=Arenibacter algicola TaxID=616991 RepID=A0A221UTM8_9FLAO|nr:DinB family protein [Arenibacter algicola]ASO04672.1 DinB superfamily protein [Arenibacter algicola]|tara:strand:+ start:2817 stop:3272 length:456 start_codon:yes stop_codon:yes gene_type:complete
MKSKTELFIELWEEARTRFTNQLSHLTQEDLNKRLLPAPNSIGFLIRHIGDVELLFAKNVFGAQEVKVIAKTVIAQKDTGEWTNLSELLEYVEYSYQMLRTVLEKQQEEDWEATITTKEFGTKTKAEAFGRIVSHTIHHSGQMVIIKKYGS